MCSREKDSKLIKKKKSTCFPKTDGWDGDPSLPNQIFKKTGVFLYPSALFSSVKREGKKKRLERPYLANL